MFRRLILVCLSLIILGAPPAASGEEVSILTWNLWGIPWLTPAASARIEAGVEILLRQSPDIVCLQEIWGRGDVAKVRRRLQSAGYSEVLHFPSWPHGSGLMIASRYPVLHSGFHRYRLQGKFYKPWHGDWYGGKGVAWVEVEIRGTRLRILNTHLHAHGGGPTSEYLPTRLAQTGELLAVLKRHQSTGVAVILCGDLNMRLHDLPMRYLLGKSTVEVWSAGTAGARSLDWILLQSGATAHLDFRKYQRLSAPAFDAKLPVSDHPFIIADVSVSDGVTIQQTGSASGTPMEEGVGENVLHVLREARIDAVKKMRWMLIIDGVLLSAALPGALWKHKTRRMRWMLLVALGLGSAWTIHFYHDQSGLNAAILQYETQSGKDVARAAATSSWYLATR